MTRIFTIRHGEREDHINLKWQNSAHRVHDPPLSTQGIQQAEDCGKFLKSKLKESKNFKPVFLVSPYIRCVQTAKTIITSMELNEDILINIEQGFGEANKHMRKRLFATHDHSNSINEITGKQRGFVEPIMLGPGDLVALAHPIGINFNHQTLHEVNYTTTGYEILNSTNKPPIDLLDCFDRMEVVLPKVLSYIEKLENETKEEIILFIVTHGSPGRAFTKFITKSDEIKFNYCTTIEILKNTEEDYSIREIWRHPTATKRGPLILA